MRTTTANTQNKPPNPSYSPSVPMYVYRELVAELKAVQARLDVVTGQNQKLAQENQNLRREFNQVVESCLELQRQLESSASDSQAHGRTKEKIKNIPKYQPKPGENIEASYISSSSPSPASPPSVKPQSNTVNNKTSNKPKKSVKQSKPKPQPSKPNSQPQQKTKHKTVSVPVMDMNFPSSETVYIEEQGVSYYISTESEAKGLSGWWLLFTIVLIMISGFSAGYLVVRPLLQSQSGNK
ncbi:MAG: hypothetical protein EAZ76_07790 [Nostocales cyanobacterium]|nr:MAG: hypothetical protein EAZ87_08310 [Nostocales cyanobacterium]TAF16244.1 MAG: hypothetical protein EAZ76_07790 [Nostocales cyanobacterium]